jgi:hypothetical protein
MALFSMANLGMLMEKMTDFEIVQMELWRSLHYAGQSLKLCQECIANNIAASNLAPLLSFL